MADAVNLGLRSRHLIPKILELARQGYGCGVIARKVGVSRPAVRRHIVNAGLAGAYRPEVNQKVINATVQRRHSDANAAKLRWRRERAKVLSEGWPAGATPAEAKILAVLYGLDCAREKDIRSACGYASRSGTLRRLTRLTREGWLVPEKRVGRQGWLWSLAPDVRAGRLVAIDRTANPDDGCVVRGGYGPPGLRHKGVGS